jgi:hypothetical protein
MMKYVKFFALFLMSVVCSFCSAQNKTELPISNTRSESKDVITYQFGPNGVYRYDGNTITDFKDKESQK